MKEIYWKDIKSADIVINLPKTFEVLNPDGENFRVYWAEDERYRAATYLVRKAKRDLEKLEKAREEKNAKSLVIKTDGGECLTIGSEGRIWPESVTSPNTVLTVEANRPATDPDDEEDPGDDIENFPTAEKVAGSETLAKDFH